MICNLVALHDVVVLLEKLRSVGARGLLPRVVPLSRSRTRAAWEHTGAPPIHWWDVPAVCGRWNRLITGDEKTGPAEYVARKYLAGKRNVRALSLGCGTGKKELLWLATGAIDAMQAFDLSRERIARARENAAKAGWGDRVVFAVADAGTLRLLPRRYDVILLDGSLHHFSPVRKVLRAVAGWLKADGLLIVNDFVGPSRFQWTDRQMLAVEHALAEIPERYRLRWQTGRPKDRVFRPGRLSVWLSDPSEVVESGLIVPALREIFEIMEWKEYGGTVLHLLLKDIAHHYIEPDPEAAAIIRKLFETEDLALQSGELTSDFVFAVCRTRNS